MTWVREAISDREGIADMAYIAIGALTASAIAALIFIFSMAAYDYANCQPITTIGKGETSVTSVIPCRFDPLPIGQAAGLIFGAFGALIGALAGYMAATKRPAGSVIEQTTVKRETTVEPTPSLPPVRAAKTGSKGCK